VATREYALSGVDTEESDRALARLIHEIAPTQAYGAKSELGIGYFAAVVRVGPLHLALTTDGVGSKLLVAEQVGRYDTVGIDCVAMNVNDLLCVGATPVAMLDYIAVERSDPEIFAQLGRGLAEGARQAQIAIVGGETALLPDMVKGAAPGRGLDLVGMAVGVVPDGGLLDGAAIEPGDVVLGVESSGVHSNGFSLARRALLGRLKISDHVPELGTTLGEELLRPTHIYVPQTRALTQAGVRPRAIAHITGDGLLNLRRVEAPVGFQLDWLPEPPPVFQLIEKLGQVDRAEMRTVFNMGVGLCAVVAPGDADKALEALRATGLQAWALGTATSDSERSVRIPAEGLTGRSNKLFARDVR
jgi:phosphoribosylformylglycinamidine cyclo-ligase